jgi:hypothetical protein
VRHDPEATRAARRILPAEGDSMMMMTLGDPSRPKRIARVRELVATGRYRPPPDAVVERLLAFLGPEPAG